MKKLIYLLMFVFAVVAFTSCQNKTQKLIVKKWDCVQVENLAPADLHYASKEDSATAIDREAQLKALSWTFNSNNTYDCSTINGITVQGTYEISSDEKTLTCMTSSGNNVNKYLITSIEDYSMILTSTGMQTPLIMHFTPH